MSSGLDFPSHEHEKMFFQPNQLAYAKKIGVEKNAGLKFEYNNVNSMLLGDILFQVTGKKADVLFEERILQIIGIQRQIKFLLMKVIMFLLVIIIVKTKMVLFPKLK